MRVSTMVWMSLAVGCGQAASSEVAPEAADPAQLAFAMGNDPDVCDVECEATGTDVFRSFIVRDSTILARFPLRRVLDQLVSSAGTTASTADDVWRQWWSSQRVRTGGDPPQHPFCDDNGGTINGFSITCPRAESALEHERLETHTPVALVNRFDLAPMDGSHCGEYRIVYAMNGLGGVADDGSVPDAPPYEGPDGRNFVIFEGVMPNPHPECGLAACLPIAQFWQELSNEDDVNVRADLLERFYFEGHCEFPPVVLPEHYGLDCRGGGGYGGACGQIRSNQFMDRDWNLREFTLERECTLPGCELIVHQTTVAQNPHPSLFDPMDPGFEPDFLAQMPRNLPIPDGVNFISAATDPRYDAGESIASPGAPGENDYVADATFDASINTELGNLGMPPTVDSFDVTERATTQSCGGCHEISNGDDLGNTNGFGANVIWPQSLRFVHIDEASNISPALINEFLPHRQKVMDQFLQTTCGTSCLNVDQFIVKFVEASQELELQPDLRFELVDPIRWEELQPTLPEFDTLSGSLVH